jgi:hypothetical protein
MGAKVLKNSTCLRRSKARFGPPTSTACGDAVSEKNVVIDAEVGRKYLQGQRIGEIR